MLVTAADENNVVYSNDEGKKIIIPTPEFVNGWSSVALLAEKIENSGEKEYEANRRKEKITALKLPALLLLLVAFSAGAALSFYNSSALIGSFTGFALLLLLKLTGVIVTALLLWYEIDKAAPALQKICTAGAKTNCNAILSAKQSKVFHWLSWSEVGFFYFATGFVSLLIAGFTTNLPLLFLITALNITALPYTLFSVYYQWHVAKQWCVLCLSVQVLLLLEFITAWSTGLLSIDFLSSPIVSFFPFVAGLLLIAIAWFLVKPLLLTREAAKRTKRELARLKASPQIWEALAAKQKRITHPTEGLGIMLGNPAATNTLIKVCNPYCGPCAKAHPEIEKLLEERDNLKVQIIFTATNDDRDKKAPPVKHLLAIAEKEDEQLIRLALDDWYLADKKDYEQFAAKYPMNGELKKQDTKVEAMRMWCDEMKIAFTPTIFINGYQLPEVYNIADLHYLIQ